MDDNLINEIAERLNARAETWRCNTNDPHNINTAIYVALAEVAQAILDAKAKHDSRNE